MAGDGSVKRKGAEPEIAVWPWRNRMKEPLVSVVMPAYNSAATIVRAIESVKAQDADLELLVIDDCSRDGLEQVMERYREDPAVFYVRNETQTGAAGSRNRGVAMARGKYTAFLDSDDWWEEGKLQKQLALLKKTGYVLCCTARELAAADGSLTGCVIPVREQITYRKLLRHNCINCSSVLVRTDVMREFPMEHEEAHEDYIAWLRILKKYRYACAVNEPLLKYRVSKSGKSGGKAHSAAMTYRTYRCVGFGPVRAAACFCSYAVNGVVKYGLAQVRAARGSKA